MNSLWVEPPLSEAEIKRLVTALAPGFARFLAERKLPAALYADLARLYLPLAAWLAQQVQRGRPLMVGINGAQGSGKSTLCTLLAWLLDQGFGCRSAVLSLDDLYLTHAQRQELAVQVHPLLATRGVPGTHDVALGVELFDRLCDARADTETPLPRFDKAQDDRASESSWELFNGRPALVLFEGWCVGAVVQPEAALLDAVNPLEVDADPSGDWRAYVNRQLSHKYQELFDRLDLLLMLKIPRWEMVYHWRSKQERSLAAQQSGHGVMDAEELRRFVMHYERLTRYQLAEMSGRADLVLELNEGQRVKKIGKKAAPA